jgi:hypothetical protein
MGNCGSLQSSCCSTDKIIYCNFIAAMLRSYLARESTVSTKAGWTRERTVRFSQQKSIDSGKLNETMFRRPQKE